MKTLFNSFANADTLTLVLFIALVALVAVLALVELFSKFLKIDDFIINIYIEVVNRNAKKK